MTGPFLVRVISASLAGVGGNVGRLTSVGTLGSLAGTLLIGYCLLPLLPNSVTMYLTGLALILVSLGFFIIHRRGPVLPLVAALAVAAGLGLWLQHHLKPHYQWAVQQFRGNSHFGQIEVVDRPDGAYRFYLNDFLTQNTYDPDTRQSLSAFTYMLAGLARAYATNITDVLCIGLGVGIVPRDFAEQGARVDVVEINAAIPPVAKRFFDLPLERLNLTIDDGRHFLNRCSKQYDAVILDAFLGDSSPSHLMTREAFASVRRVLRPGGVLVINMFGSVEEGRDFFAASLCKTLRSVFPGVRMHSRGEGAIFFVATDRPDPRFVHPPDFSHVHPESLAEVQADFANTVEPAPDHGRVLTDDYNPVEFYDARNRETLRRTLAVNARRM
jgi:spermidine synthase